MAYRIRVLDEAMRRSRREIVELGEQLAEARRLAGATQTEVAAALGWSGSKVRRIERGQRESASHLELTSFGAVVGLRYSGRFFVGAARLRDATQLAMLNSFRSWTARQGWTSRTEEPLPITGDLRAFDLVLRRNEARVACEFVSRIRDGQAQIRPLLQKQRDAGVGTLVLVVRDTAENRRSVRDIGPLLHDLFPLQPRAILSAMREGRDPGANGVVFWREARAGGSGTDSVHRR